jgi:hypothetical protein
VNVSLANFVPGSALNLNQIESIQINPIASHAICFTICLCISPDLDGNRGTKNETCISPDLVVARVRHFRHFTICSRVCFNFLAWCFSNQRGPAPSTLPEEAQPAKWLKNADEKDAKADVDGVGSTVLCHLFNVAGEVEVESTQGDF